MTSVGSPAPVIGPLHDAGALVFADVASIRHAERAVAAGAVAGHVDGEGLDAAEELGQRLGPGDLVQQRRIVGVEQV